MSTVVNKLYLLIGEPGWDDSEWVDGIFSTADQCAERLIEEYTKTGKLRQGQKASFPYGWRVAGYTLVKGQWQPNADASDDPFEREVKQLLQKKLKQR